LVVGFSLGHCLGGSGLLIVTDLPFSAVVYSAVSGLIIAGLQSLVLRRYVSRVNWWIVGSVAGFTVGLALTGFLFSAMSDAQGDSIPPSSYMNWQ
jgi:hypothetical protein